MTTSSTSPRSSASALDTPLAGTPVRALWTGAGDGDMRFIGEGPAPAPVPDTLAVRRPHQAHGSRVLVVDSPGHEVPDGALPWAWGPRHSAPEGDAVVASGSGFALAVLTADCAAVALGSPEGVHGAVHVGWRGLGAGILPGAIDTMRRLGASTVVAGMGPCIGPCCYEFSAEDLGALRASCGAEVEGTTTWGVPSLDLPAAVRGQLSRSGVSTLTAVDSCTMCTSGYFSHRGRGDEARQGLFVWRLP
ncbi:MAG TPA: polyphenol oxidase family protein [Acidimicrobiales bacterium]|nr:polyphenol oxidase family protein [Acidimicrobiales bacterium]